MPPEFDARAMDCIPPRADGAKAWLGECPFFVGDDRPPQVWVECKLESTSEFQIHFDLDFHPTAITPRSTDALFLAGKDEQRRTVVVLQAFELGSDLHIRPPEVLLATDELEAVVDMQDVAEAGQEFLYLQDGPAARLVRLDMASGELATIVDATTCPAIAGKKIFGMSRYPTEQDLLYSFRLSGPDGGDSLDRDETVTLTDLGTTGTMDRIGIRPPAGGKGRQG